MIQMAIIGLGWAGQRQLEAVHELSAKIRVSCLVDNDMAHLQAIVDDRPIPKLLTNYADALTVPEIDAVSICTPHPLHSEMSIAAAEAGKHVLVEKPMALTVEDADRMITAAAQNGIKLYVAENAVYTPRARFLREVVKHGKPIGAITAASVATGFRAPDFGYPGRRAWLTNPGQGGTGTWMLHGIHTVAELRYILGDVATVYMQEHKTATFQRRDLEGTMSGLFTLESGVAVSILQTTESKFYGDLDGYTLHGEEGLIQAGKTGYRLFNAETDTALPPLRPYPSTRLSSYALELNAFADYINRDVNGPTTGERNALADYLNDDTVAPTTGERERHSLAIVQAGYESAQSGQPVHLRERFGA